MDVKLAKAIDNRAGSGYNRTCQGDRPHRVRLILGCALAYAFTHRFTKGFRVGLQMPCLLRVDGSKQPQVSALPERRVKKQKQTASTGYFKELARAPFFCTKKPSPSGNFEKPCFRKHSLGKKPCFTGFSEVMYAAK